MKDEIMELDLTWGLEMNVEEPMDESGPLTDVDLTLALPYFAELAKAAAISDGDQGNEIKKCSSCGILDTPTWRRGPDGPKTLCNACGLRYLRTERKTSEERAIEELMSRTGRRALEDPEFELSLDIMHSSRRLRKRPRRSI